jgi:LmbE family N-acetylglucosaminyl deacetylase
MTCIREGKTNITQVKYCDHQAGAWIRQQGPLRWRDHVDVQFKNIGFETIEAAASLRQPEVVSKWLNRLERRLPIPPLVVCGTTYGTFYVLDGNHRVDAFSRFLDGRFEAIPIRVAEVVPKAGYEFRYRWLKTFGTFLLEPAEPAHPAGVHRVSRVPAEIVLPGDRVEQLTGDVSELAVLFGRTLALVAHPDDETACAALLHRAREPLVVFCTDGAPNSPFFWGPFVSRAKYAAVRREEAQRALPIIGIPRPKFLSTQTAHLTFPDQELYQHLDEAFESLLQLALELRVESIVTPAYEGGHPDHDTCSFLAYLLGRELSIQVWEMPLYHRSHSGSLIHQEFLNPNGTEAILHPTAQEFLKRSEMLSTYTSQPDASQFVNSPVELYRPQPEYDYSRPPHPGQLNYEVWQWPMSGSEVCQAFRSYLSRFTDPHIAAGARAVNKYSDDALELAASSEISSN